LIPLRTPARGISVRKYCERNQK